MNRKRVLIVEDDPHISNLVKYNLENSGLVGVISTSGEDALERLDREAFDVIILDIMLPNIDGFETCRLIKQEKRLSTIPIVMLTAKGEEVDKVVGFELGADDYVVKPFSPRELVLRVKAILKRGIPEEERSLLNVEKISVDVDRHKVTVNNKEIQLTQIEFKLLVTFMRRKGRVQSRDRLFADVWDIAAEISSRTIDAHIKRLRMKLGKSGKLIETVRGIGYRLSEGD